MHAFKHKLPGTSLVRGQQLQRNAWVITLRHDGAASECCQIMHSAGPDSTGRAQRVMQQPPLGHAAKKLRG
eukprot:1976157-Alexandrium_andersonii.AAC.1